ncbi:MAG: 30S ribosomal protein S17e [Candidatus Woesearchaeota archaeon]
MGRIKTKLVKALTEEVYQKFKDRFTTDFTKNKEILKEVEQGASKKLRNVIAGYTTRMKIRDIRDEV